MSIGNGRLAKPFLKWAGGKTQLIPAVQKALPADLKRRPFTYVEPFVGSGAVFFWFIRTFPNVEKFIINDVNRDLIDTYKTIKSSPEEFVKALSQLESAYNNLTSTDKKKDFFLAKRSLFNSRSMGVVDQSAVMVFLNRTCFNGLYRVNSKNEFNVPFGKYLNPTICDERNIYNVSAALQNVTILNSDFSVTSDYIDDNAFFYFDPPYKPLSQTASFNSYSKDEFGDEEQRRLKQFCDLLDERHALWLLSNSDPQNTDPANNFFDDLYCNYKIDRVKARRMINADASKRGEIHELLIHNYDLIHEPTLF